MSINHMPVFAAPARGRGAAKANPETRPVDLVQLSRQTGGDRVLEEEVLRLFLRQAGTIGRIMRERETGDARKRAAHTLKGAAQSIGAGPVALSAQKVEDDPAEQANMARLLKDIDRTCDFINSLLR